MKRARAHSSRASRRNIRPSSSGHTVALHATRIVAVWCGFETTAAGLTTSTGRWCTAPREGIPRNCRRSHRHRTFCRCSRGCTRTDCLRTPPRAGTPRNCRRRHRRRTPYPRSRGHTRTRLTSRAFQAGTSRSCRRTSQCRTPCLSNAGRTRRNSLRRNGSLARKAGRKTHTRPAPVLWGPLPAHCSCRILLAAPTHRSCLPRRNRCRKADPHRTREPGPRCRSILRTRARDNHRNLAHSFPCTRRAKARQHIALKHKSTEGHTHHSSPHSHRHRTLCRRSRGHTRTGRSRTSPPQYSFRSSLRSYRLHTPCPHMRGRTRTGRPRRSPLQSSCRNFRRSRCRRTPCLRIPGRTGTDRQRRRPCRQNKSRMSHHSRRRRTTCRRTHGKRTGRPRTPRRSRSPHIHSRRAVRTPFLRENTNSHKSNSGRQYTCSATAGKGSRRGRHRSAHPRRTLRLRISSGGNPSSARRKCLARQATLGCPSQNQVPKSCPSHPAGTAERPAAPKTLNRRKPTAELIRAGVWS